MRENVFKGQSVAPVFEHAFIIEQMLPVMDTVHIPQGPPIEPGAAGKERKIERKDREKRTRSSRACHPPSPRSGRSPERRPPGSGSPLHWANSMLAVTVTQSAERGPSTDHRRTRWCASTSALECTGRRPDRSAGGPLFEPPHAYQTFIATQGGGHHRLAHSIQDTSTRFVDKGACESN